MTEHLIPNLATFPWQITVLDRHLTAPPGSPAEGDRYIVAAGATGAWAGHDYDIAEWTGSAWDFTDPSVGMTAFVEDERIARRWIASGLPWINANLNMELVLERTLERLLTGVLDSGNAVPVSVTWPFGSAASDANGAVNWTGAGWVSSVGYRATNGVSQYVEGRFRIPNTSDIVLNRGVLIPANPESTAEVKLNGAVHGTWDQSNFTYTLASVAAGNHLIRLTRDANADAHVLYLGSVQHYHLPYQPKGVPNDTFRIDHGLSWAFVHTFGTGPTDNGAAGSVDYECPTMSHRLPAGSTSNDLLLARDALVPAGWALGANRGILRLMLTVPMTLPIEAGNIVNLSSTAGTRGYRITQSGFGWELPYFATAFYHDLVWAAFVTITTPGAGSAFVAGEPAMFVMMRSVSSASGANPIVTGDVVDRAADLVKIPLDLW